MCVIVTDTDGAWRMADVIWVDGGARNPKVPTLFQVADVDTGVINWVNADLVTHIKHYAQWIDETTLVDRVA